MHGSNSQFSLALQATMVIAVRESVVNRYVRRATTDMYRNNRKDIRCPLGFLYQSDYSIELSEFGYNRDLKSEGSYAITRQK